MAVSKTIDFFRLVTPPPTMNFEPGWTLRHNLYSAGVAFPDFRERSAHNMLNYGRIGFFFFFLLFSSSVVQVREDFRFVAETGWKGWSLWRGRTHSSTVMYYVCTE